MVILLEAVHKRSRRFNVLGSLVLYVVQMGECAVQTQLTCN